MRRPLSIDRLGQATWPIRTDRLTIRRATPDDAVAVWEIRSLPDIARWLPSDGGTAPSFARTWSSSDALARQLVVEAEGRIVGDLFCNVVDGLGQEEVAEQVTGVEAVLGWVLTPSVQGRGLATEAVSALVRLCFNELGVRRVSAVAYADNAASIRVMEKVGMRQEAHFVRDSLHRDLGWIDTIRYALLAEEWAAQD